MVDDKEIMMNYQALDEFDKQLFQDILTSENVAKPEVHFGTLHLPDGGKKGDGFWGAVLEKNDKQYLLPLINSDSGIDRDLSSNLPLEPTMTVKVSHKNSVYHLIKGYNKVSVVPKKSYSFRECVKRLVPFSHTQSRQQLLFTLITIAQYYGRANVRFSTPPGFGKDSLNTTLERLVGEANTVVKPTAAKLEMLAGTNKLLALSEVTDIQQSVWRDIEQFLLDAGDFKPRVTKRSRAYEGVGEFIDISELSLALFYNDVDNYKGDEYFDDVTKGAVIDRFLPFRLYGTLESDFSAIETVNIPQFVSERTDQYKQLIKTFLWFGDRFHELADETGFDISVNLDSQRWESSMITILKAAALYAEDGEEFESIKSDLLKAHKDYQHMIDYRRIKQNRNLSYDEQKKLLKHKTYKERLHNLKMRHTEESSVGGLEQYG